MFYELHIYAGKFFNNVQNFNVVSTKKAIMRYKIQRLKTFKVSSWQLLCIKPVNSLNHMNFEFKKLIITLL